MKTLHNRKGGIIMSKWKKRLIIGAISLSLPLFAACSSEESEKVVEEDKSIEFWTISLQPTFNDHFEEVIQKFESENEGVTVVWKDYPYDTLKNKLLTSISSGDAPDIVNINAEMALSMGDKKALSNADDYLSTEFQESFFPGIYDAPRFDDQTLAVPWYTTSPVMYINTKMLQDAGIETDNYPTTFDELVMWVRNVNKETGKYGMAVVPDIRDSLLTNGVEIFNEERTEAIFNTDEAVEIMTELQRMVEDKVATKDAATMDAQVQMFGSGELASVIAGTTFINSLKSTSPDIYENTIAIEVPYENPISSTMFLTVPEASNNKDLSYKFVEYVTNSEAQIAFSKKANTLPSTSDSIQDSFFTESNGSLEDEAKVAAGKGLLNAKELAIDIELLDQTNKGLQSIILSNKDVKTELDNTVSAVNEKLK